MLNRIPQPPVDRASRAREGHDFWPGIVVALAGAALAFCGARHLTNLGTVDGGTASETQLVRAFSSGGLQYADQIVPPPPPKLEGVANPGEALARWQKQRASFQRPTWKVRVDSGATTPCPT
jgi:hypothetical protein